MSMFKILAKLEKIKEFFTSEVPDVLDWTANVLKEVQDGLLEASSYLKDLGDNPQMTGEKAKQFCHDREVLTSYEDFFLMAPKEKLHTGDAKSSADAGLKNSVSQIVLDFIMNIKTKTDLSV